MKLLPPDSYLNWGHFFGTVYCRIAGASGGFASWTPTRALSSYSRQMKYGHSISCFRQDTTFIHALMTIWPTTLNSLKMSICYKYVIKWRYEFNDSKSGIVTFVECKTQHFESMKNRVWLLRDTIVDELHEYKNLGK